MAEKQDIAMNQFQVVTDVEYIYGETANGSQVKIKKSDLFTSVFAYKGLLGSGKDLNTISENGIYYSAFAENSPKNISGLLLHYAENDMASQILINSRNGELYTRSRVYNTGNWDKWTEWKSITLT
jgi:hypothetical protein